MVVLLTRQRVDPSCLHGRNAEACPRGIPEHDAGVDVDCGHFTVSRMTITTLLTAMRAAIVPSHATAALRGTGRPARSETRSIRYSPTCRRLPGLGIRIIPCLLLVLHRSPAEDPQSCDWCYASGDNGQHWKLCNRHPYKPAAHGNVSRQG